jgi:WD40 repeat protein
MARVTRKTRAARWALLAVLFGLVLVCPWTRAADEEKTPKDVVAILKGHTDPVYSIAFSPDGKFVATASWDSTLKLWNAETGKEIKTFGGPNGHREQVLTVAFHPDGHSLASGGSDRTVKVWDVPSDSPLYELALKSGVNGIALSVDGKLLAAGSKDGSIQLWQAADGKELFNFPGHKGAVTGLAFSPNGQVLISSGRDNTLRFWNPATGKPAGEIGAHEGGVTTVVVSPNNNAFTYSAGKDGTVKTWQINPLPAARSLPAHEKAVTALALVGGGNQVLSGGADKVVRLSNFNNGQQVKEFAGAETGIRAVAAAPNGNLIAAGTADNRVCVWNANDAKRIGQVVAHRKPVTSVAFHPQGNLATAGGDGLVKVWLPPVASTSLTHPEAVLAAAMTADGKRLFTGGADKIVRSWNVTNRQMERQFSGHGGEVTAVAVTGNGQQLASGGTDHTIRFWNQNTGKEAQSIGGHTGTVTALGFSPEGQQLLSSSADGSVKLWKLPLAAPKSFLHADQVTSLALSEDGSQVVTGCNDKQVQLWNLSNGQSTKFGGNNQGIAAVAVSPKMDAVAAGGEDKSLTVWNATNGQVIKKLTLDAVARGVAFSPDGKQLAAGLADKSVRLFDVAMGKEVKSFKGHGDEVNAVVFNRKGDRVISASADKTVRVWDIAAGSAKLKMEHDDAVLCLALSKDGSRLLSGGKDKVINVWKLADGSKAAGITTPTQVNGVGFSPKGRIVAGGSDNLVRIYNAAGKLEEFFAHEGKVLAVAFHPEEKQVISASADKTVRVWTSALVWQKNLKGDVRQAVFSPKGDQVVAAAGKTLQVWNAEDGKEVKTALADKKGLIGVGVSADGGRVVSVGEDRKVKVWELVPAKKGARKEKEAEGEDEPARVFAAGGEPQSIALSPNGTKVAVAVAGKVTNPIHVFDAASGVELLVLSDHQGEVPALQFQSDNRTLVSASKDKTARLSDVGVVRVLDAHKGGVAGVEYDNNGNTILTGGADKTVKLWDAATGKLKRTFVPLDDPVAAVAYSRDYTKVGAAAGKVLKVWNTEDGKEVLSLTHPAKVTSLSFSSDRTKIVTGAADNLARVWDAVTGQELEFFTHEEAVRAVQFHPNNTAVISAGADKTVAVHTLALNKVIPALKGSVLDLALANGGSHVLTAGADRTVGLWNLSTGKLERRFTGAAGAVNAVAAARNNVLVAAGGTDKTVRVYNFADGKLLGRFKAPGSVRGLSFSPNSQTLSGVCADGTLITYNVIYNQGQPVPPEFGKTLQTFTHGGAATAVVFGNDNMTVYTGSADKKVRSWKVAAEAPTKNFQLPNFADVVAFNGDGSLLATACHDGIVRIYDVAKNQVVRQITAHNKMNETAIYCLVWTKDDKQLLTGSQDKTLKLWNAATGALIREFKAYQEKAFEKGHQDSVYAAAISPDGKWIASGDADRVIKIWNAADGSVVRDLVNPGLKGKGKEAPKSHPGKVYHLRFTKDGKYLVSTGEARYFKGFLGIWSMKDSKLVYSKEMPWGTFYGVAISPDDKRLALACGADSRDAKSVNSSYVIKMPELEKKE